MIKKKPDYNTVQLELIETDKKFREKLVEFYSINYPLMTTELMTAYELESLKDKYVTKHRKYDRNSRERNIIKIEEIFFIKKIISMSKIIDAFFEYNEAILSREKNEFTIAHNISRYREIDTDTEILKAFADKLNVNIKEKS